jgi:hypothetical protein
MTPPTHGYSPISRVKPENVTTEYADHTEGVKQVGESAFSSAFCGFLLHFDGNGRAA